MARKRMIDPAFWQSEHISRLSLFERLVFIGLFSLADDEGRGRANPRLLCSELFPYDRVKTDDMVSALANIARYASVVFYEAGGCAYYSLLNWKKWQKVEKPRPSLIPPCPEPSSSIPRSLVEESANSRGSVAPNIIEKNIREEKKNIKENKEKEIKEEIHKEEKLAGADARACGAERHCDESPPSRKCEISFAHGKEELIRLLLSPESGEIERPVNVTSGQGLNPGAPSGGP